MKGYGMLGGKPRFLVKKLELVPFTTESPDDIPGSFVDL
jgi:hypothetical protein